MAQRDGWRARARQAEAAMAVVRTLALEHVEHADGCGLLAGQLLAALDAQRPEERSDERCICGTPGTGDFDGPHRDCPVHGERNGERYCVCPDCTRCGCGIWEKHHANLSEITRVPARSDAGLPADGEERTRG